MLFYRGSYPNADDWGLVGRGRVGQQVSYNASIAYQGDSLLLCDTGIVSLRDLFLKGSENAQSLSVNSNVQKQWSDLISGARNADGYPVGPLFPGVYNFTGVWDQKKDRLVIYCPYYLYPSIANYSNVGNFFFVFDTLLQSWTTHQSFVLLNSNPLTPIQYTNLVRYKNETLMLVLQSMVGIKPTVYSKEAATGFTDRNFQDTAETGYDYTMLSAPIPFPKTAVYEATQIEPILESDLYAQTNWNFVVDFGRQTSGNQPTDAATTSVAKPAVNVGMQNITYVQVKMSGTTVSGKTVGLNLYSYNVWYDAGQKGSR